MRSSERIVMFIHDPTGTAEPVPCVRTLALLATQAPTIWPDRKGPGRTLIYEIDQRDIANDVLRKAS
ncbi:hypothetical protein [Elioraea sp.]|uniref:hypothetical protein n=1 Tax=Elioraea sp. TaxID=2185103 RepID=UPI0025BED1F6|nr:hypothetical protein [Elioraea sp.]